jgi:hypothetical protein
MSTRSDYALLSVLEHLGADPGALNLDWAEFVGDESTVQRFEVGTRDPTDAYIELQAYDVGAFGHEILVNGEPLSGFDLPPAEGWQLWMDAVTGAGLREGENTVQVVRDPDSGDEFAVGNLIVHWRQV